MKLISYFKDRRSDKAPNFEQPPVKPTQKKKPAIASQRVVSIFPAARIHEADWLKLHRAMDMAG